MRMFIAGLIVGASVSLVSAKNPIGFYTSGELLQKTDLDQIMYVAGIGDALHAITNWVDDTDENIYPTLQAFEKCFDDRNSRLGAAWQNAMDSIKGSGLKTQAAQAILSGTCGSR